MKLGRAERKAKTHRGEPVILFAVGGYRFACPADAVDEIRALEGLQPIATGFAHSRLGRVKFILERDGGPWFVVDANLHFRVPPSMPSRLLVLHESRAAVLVDAVDRMAEVAAVQPLPRAFRGEERQWFRGVALIGEDVVPVVNPAAFLSKAEQAVLEGELAKAKAVSA